MEWLKKLLFWKKKKQSKRVEHTRVGHIYKYFITITIDGQEPIQHEDIIEPREASSQDFVMPSEQFWYGNLQRDMLSFKLKDRQILVPREKLKTIIINDPVSMGTKTVTYHTWEEVK